MPNQPPHPPFSDTYVLPKTKYGRPVTEEMFQNNNFVDEEDHKARWWEAVWAEEEAKQRRLRQERQEREEYDEFPEIDRSQRYQPTTAEELEAYRQWKKDVEENSRKQARDRRFRRAAREAEEMLMQEKITVRMQVDVREVEGREQIVPWEWQEQKGVGDENGYSGESSGGGDEYRPGEGQEGGQEANKLRKWFKKVLP